MVTESEFAIMHIKEQLREISKISNSEIRQWSDGVLNGMCSAYFNMGLISLEQWDDFANSSDRVA